MGLIWDYSDQISVQFDSPTQNVMIMNSDISLNKELTPVLNTRMSIGVGFLH